MKTPLFLIALLMLTSTAASAHPGHGDISHPILFSIGAASALVSFYCAYKIKRIQKKQKQEIK